MAKADYIHSIEQYRNQVPVLVVEDIDLGNKSVTNDIENVMADIAKMEGIDPANYLVVVKDSKGSWDGWDHKAQQFEILNEEKWWDAAAKFIQLRIKKTLASS
jgi:hypothetical protein